MNRNNTKRSRRIQERKAGKVLMIVFIAVLFVGMFAQIAMIARLTRQNKQLRAVEAGVKQLGATAENLTLAINQLSEPGQLEAHARRLGMQTPSPEQLRVVNLPDVIDDTSAQSVENTDTEESRE